ncbi:hypothetical protein DFH06DRAFT_1309006 [Mycena polygramma]|nr:hypothetical protein DFH06DRAFT_1309006 [Mycena polygramma]
MPPKSTPTPETSQFARAQASLASQKMNSPQEAPAAAQQRKKRLGTKNRDFFEPRSRPAIVSELTDAIKQELGTNSPIQSLESLKQLLRRAEKHRKGGANNNTTEQGADSTGLDLELASIEYGCAATLVLETIPKHRDYRLELGPEQRKRLSEHGNDLLLPLGRLKAALVKWYEEYARSPGATAEALPTFMVARQRQNEQRNRDDDSPNARVELTLPIEIGMEKGRHQGHLKSQDRSPPQPEHHHPSGSMHMIARQVSVNMICWEGLEPESPYAQQSSGTTGRPPPVPAYITDTATRTTSYITAYSHAGNDGGRSSQ